MHLVPRFLSNRRHIDYHLECLHRIAMQPMDAVAFPPRIDARGVSVFWLAFGSAIGILLVNAAWAMAGQPGSRFPVVGLLCSLLVIGVFMERHLRARRFLERPYVLFLRRFSTFADRTLMGEVLRRCPAGKPVVFLVPTRSRPGDWGILHVSFAGLKLWRPLGSLPVIIGATDDNWRPVIRELIECAETIVVDASLPGASVLDEIEMIVDGGQSDKTLVLTTGTTEWTSDQRLQLLVGGDAEIVTYSKSWIRAIPRILFGIVAAFFPAFMIVVSILAFSFLLLVGPLAASGLIAEASVTAFLGESERWLGFVENAVVIAYFWICVVFFLRPSVDKSTARRLSDRLHQTKVREAPNGHRFLR